MKFSYSTGPLALVLCAFTLGCAMHVMDSEHIVTRDRGEVYNGINREQVATVVREHQNAVTGCYKSGAEKNPKAQGKVILHWSIKDSGQVTQTTVKSSTLGLPEAETCLAAEVKTWKFAELAKGKEAEVTYPFIFFGSGQ